MNKSLTKSTQHVAFYDLQRNRDFKIMKST